MSQFQPMHPRKKHGKKNLLCAIITIWKELVPSYSLFGKRYSKLGRKARQALQQEPRLIRFPKRQARTIYSSEYAQKCARQLVFRNCLRHAIPVSAKNAASVTANTNKIIQSSIRKQVDRFQSFFPLLRTLPPRRTDTISSTSTLSAFRFDVNLDSTGQGSEQLLSKHSDEVSLRKVQTTLPLLSEFCYSSQEISDAATSLDATSTDRDLRIALAISKKLKSSCPQTSLSRLWDDFSYIFEHQCEKKGLNFQPDETHPTSESFSWGHSVCAFLSHKFTLHVLHSLYDTPQVSLGSALGDAYTASSFHEIILEYSIATYNSRNPWLVIFNCLKCHRFDAAGILQVPFEGIESVLRLFHSPSNLKTEQWFFQEATVLNSLLHIEKEDTFRSVVLLLLIPRVFFSVRRWTLKELSRIIDGSCSSVDEIIWLYNRVLMAIGFQKEAPASEDSAAIGGLHLIKEIIDQRLCAIPVASDTRNDFIQRARRLFYLLDISLAQQQLEAEVHPTEMCFLSLVLILSGMNLPASRSSAIKSREMLVKLSQELSLVQLCALDASHFLQNENQASGISSDFSMLLRQVNSGIVVLLSALRSEKQRSYTFARILSITDLSINRCSIQNEPQADMKPRRNTLWELVLETVVTKQENAIKIVDGIKNGETSTWLMEDLCSVLEKGAHMKNFSQLVISLLQILNTTVSPGWTASNQRQLSTFLDSVLVGVLCDVSSSAFSKIGSEYIHASNILTLANPYATLLNSLLRRNVVCAVTCAKILADLSQLSQIVGEAKESKSFFVGG